MKFEDLKKLQQKKHRQVAGHFLVEGEHLVLELQKAAARSPLLLGCELYVTAVHEHWRSPFKTHVISHSQMAQISETQTPQGIVALVPMLPAAAPLDEERVVYLYEIQDPGNLGTILRTLAWFGKLRCLLSPDSVDPYNSKVLRASAGAIFHVPIELDVELESLGRRFAKIACLDMTGESLRSTDFKSCDCYLFGNEARGLPREPLALLKARPFSITGHGTLESLNVASAVNMCVYELNR
jgi:TrmH family RNA methyltransferase